MNKYFKDSLDGQKHPPWQPTYTITSATANAPLEIEAARAVVEHTPQHWSSGKTAPAGTGMHLIRKLSATYRHFISNAP